MFTVEENLDLIISIQVIKNDCCSGTDKIESRIEKKYQNFVKTANAKLDVLSKK